MSQPSVRVQAVVPRESDSNWGFGILSRAINASEAELSATEAASTLFRFFRSKHIADLRLFFKVAAATFMFHIVVVGVGAILYLIKHHNFEGLLECGSLIVKYTGPAVPIYGAVIAWSYLTAASRLGTVDLFACEIVTLCRVGTIFDIGKRYVQQYETPPQSQGAGFTSEEEYFPVFSSNSSDLKLLEATVVTNITEFYTYMKAARDCQRKLSLINNNKQAWQEIMASMIFVLFLGFESARKAVNDLVEFQPTRAENMAVILLTELECYKFLIGHFKKEDLRHARLLLRRQDYEETVPSLIKKVATSYGKAEEIALGPIKKLAPSYGKDNEKYWAGAQQMVTELDQRYRAAMAKIGGGAASPT